MKLQFSWKYILAFIALNMLAGELHEQVHINTGYFVCGCYGPRDFNVWSTCAACGNPAWAFLATLAGPLFSCGLMWLGACWFVKNNSDTKKAVGISLLFANLPFARIFTALTGGGDEKIVIQSLIGDVSNGMLSKVLASMVVMLVCLPPMVMVFKQLDSKNRWWIITGYCILPLVFGLLYQRMLWNRLLLLGTGAPIHLLGTPDIILFHFAIMLLMLTLSRKAIVQLVSAGEQCS